MLVIYSGDEIWKTGYEMIPYFADRNFVYLTGLTCRSAVLLAGVDCRGAAWERLYLLAPDAIA